MTFFNVTVLSRILKAVNNPIYEFPPLDGGIPAAKVCTKDLNDSYPSPHGLLYAKYKFTVTNASSIMPGTYGAAYSNSIWQHSNSTSYSEFEHAPSGAFDKQPAIWYQRSGDAAPRHLII
jgi:hypothetical protein